MMWKVGGLCMRQFITTKKHQMSDFSSDAGVSLIETALVILVLSLILVPLFQTITQERERRAAFTELQKYDRLVSAVNEYFKNNRSYPCPADLADTATSANFGLSTACAAGAGIHYGALPFGDLQLPWNYGVNRYGWRFMYAVTRNLTAGPNADGAIEIRDDLGVFADDVDFVIIDPGPDGKGSQTIFGGASGLACATSIDAENCDADITFVDRPYAALDNKNDANHNDDRLLYSLGTENNAMFIVKSSGSAAADKIDIINRNDGNIGIGFADNNGDINILNKPEDKLHVSGSNCNAGSCADKPVSARVMGTTKVGGDANSTNVRAANTVRATTGVVSTNYCYGAAC